MISQKRFAFIDRDGTIIQEPPDEQIDSIEKLEFVPGTISALKELSRRGFELVMVTNQDGLGTAQYPQAVFDEIQGVVLSVLGSEGVWFRRIAVCPHFLNDGCDCRKPRLGLVLEELKSGLVDLKRSYVIGDRHSDLQLAENMGIQGIQLTAEVGWPRVLARINEENRKSEVQRHTKETRITVNVDLDGDGEYDVQTGLGFFDHMLEQLSRHSGIDLKVHCRGDLEIDEHHTVEDVALALGQALAEALGDKHGIERYGFFVPMDETLAQAVLDLSGRPYFVFEGHWNREKVGDLPTELVPHFFRSLCESLKANLHLKVVGENTHHMVEACFKATARALGQAVQRSEKKSIPSTKGSL